ncbi:MAG: EthD domain-containing protein [Gammaproteobacteria bacterium]
MLGLFSFLIRKDGMTHAEFSDHWRNVHARIALENSGSMRHVRRYVQNHLVPGMNDSAPFDGVAEAWYEDAAALRALFEDRDYRAVVHADEQRFLEVKRCVTVITEPVPMYESAAARGEANAGVVRLLALMARKPGITLGEFSRYWRERHGPLVLGLGSLQGRALRYVQNHRVAESPFPSKREPAWDGVADVWYESAQACTGAMDPQQYERVIAPDEEKFVDRSRLTFLIVSPYFVIDR